MVKAEWEGAVGACEEHTPEHASSSACPPPSLLRPPRTWLRAQQLEHLCVAALGSIVHRRLAEIVGLNAGVVLQQQAHNGGAAARHRAVCSGRMPPGSAVLGSTPRRVSSTRAVEKSPVWAAKLSFSSNCSATSDGGAGATCRQGHGAGQGARQRAVSGPRRLGSSQRAAAARSAVQQSHSRHAGRAAAAAAHVGGAQHGRRLSVAQLSKVVQRCVAVAVPVAQQRRRAARHQHAELQGTGGAGDEREQGQGAVLS